MPRLTFLFKAGRKERLQSGKKFPSEFFYGYCQLVDQGVECVIREEEELGLGVKSPLARILNFFGGRLFGVPFGAVFRVLLSRSWGCFQPSEVLIATTTTFGLVLAVLKFLGLMKNRVVFLAMGLCEEEAPFLHRLAYRRLLRHLVITTLSRGDQVRLRQVLGAKATVKYLQFGVDYRFWVPESDDTTSPRCGNSESFVLSIGNDRHRDYPTLINAWQPGFPKLKIITRLPVPFSPANVEIIKGDWRTQVLSDERIRSLFRKAQFIVLPIRQTSQPSGQSACLQAMACGKAVMLSDIDGLWDRQLMVNRENCILVPPGKPSDLRESIAELLKNPELLERIGSKARQVVENSLNADNMADNLLRITEAPGV